MSYPNNVYMVFPWIRYHLLYKKNAFRVVREARRKSPVISAINVKDGEKLVFFCGVFRLAFGARPSNLLHSYEFLLHSRRRKQRKRPYTIAGRRYFLHWYFTMGLWSNRYRWARASTSTFEFSFAFSTDTSNDETCELCFCNGH